MTAVPFEYHGRNIRVQYRLLLVIAVLLAAYYPLVFGDLSRIDDIEIIEPMRNAESWNLRDLFTPQMKEGLYYRPILILSYHFDKYLFNLDAGFMHIENMILHLINALLLFWLSSQLVLDHKEGKSLIPLLSALFFGLHPITTESVCWIAGRTDVLASTFVLLSANCIIRFKKVGSSPYMALSAFFMCLAFLTKETALAFLPGAVLLMSSPLPSEMVTEQNTPQNAHNPYRNILFLLFGSGAILLFFLLRHFAFATNKSTIGATLLLIRTDTIRSFLIFMQAFGFYAKKIFFPFPLNFSITEVDPLYELLALPVLVACFLIISKRSILSALFMSGIFLIIPSFLIALGQIAWTSFAERYLYLPTAFIMVASVFFISNSIKKFPALSERKEIPVTLLLVIMAVATFHRSTVWKDNLNLLRDTVAKNPDFCYVRGQFAYALAMQGDINNARLQFTIANEFNKTKKRLKKGGDIVHLRYWDLPELGLAELLARENKIPEAIAAYEKIILESNGEPSFGLNYALNNTLLLHAEILNDTRSRSSAERIKKKMSNYIEKYSKIFNDADTFYWVGKTFLMRGDTREALVYFKKAESKFSEDNKYKVISQKFIARLECK